MAYSNLNHTYIIIAGDCLVKRFFQKIFNRIIIIPIKNNSKTRKPAPCIKKQQCHAFGTAAFRGLMFKRKGVLCISQWDF